MFGFAINILAAIASIFLGLAVADNGGDPTLVFVCTGASVCLAFYFLIKDMD